MTTKSFKISKWFVIVNYVCISVSVVIALFLGFESIVMWETAVPAAAFVGIVAIGFIAGIIYSVSILPRMKDNVRITDQQISHEHSDGTVTTIAWDEDFEIRDRPFLGRVDLISEDGQRVIKLEQQLSGYSELMRFIKMKSMETEG